jgi:hypothetical protein
MKCTRNVSWKDSVLRWRIPRNHFLFVLALKKELDRGRYKPAPFCIFRVTEPKPREIKAPLFRDRAVQTAALDGGMRDDLSRGFIHDNSACQKGKGMDFAIRRLKCMMQRFRRRNGEDGWVASLDIHNYYGSIGHAGLKADIRPVVRNSDYLREAETVIDSFGPVGLGLGSPLSQNLALFRLSGLNHFIKEELRCKYYLRYNDNMVIIQKQEEKLQAAVSRIREELFKIGLELNPKSCVHPLSQGIVFLKWRFALTETGGILMRKRRKSVSRFIRHLRHQKRRVAAGELSKDDVRNSFMSWKSHMEKGKSYHIINRTRRLLNA